MINTSLDLVPEKVPGIIFSKYSRPVSRFFLARLVSTKKCLPPLFNLTKGC